MNTLDLMNKKSNGDVGSKISTIEIYYGKDTDEKNMIPIEQSTISEIKLTESFLKTLPTLKIKIMDTGLWFNTNTFQIGGNIKIKIYSTVESQKLNYVDSIFSIQNINYYTKQEQCKYITELNCILNYEKYINQIVNYPEDQDITKLFQSKTKTSKEVLTEILNTAGVKNVCTLKNDPKDKMNWISGDTLTFADFTRKIIDHAWISEDDLPIIYIDKNGLFTYTSLKTLCNVTSPYKYYFETVFQKKAMATENAESVLRTSLTYRDILIINAGFKQNDGGYKVTSYQYNPYNLKKINKDEQKPQKIDNEGIDSYREIEFNNKNLYLSSISNKSAKSRNYKKYSIRGGIYFKELHEYYNVAPLHHKNMRNSVFQKFVYLNIDTNKQNNTVSGPGSYPKLGQIIYIDFSDTKYGNLIHNGNYLVMGLTHIWIPNKSYTISLQTVSDGINNLGQNDTYAQKFEAK